VMHSPEAAAAAAATAAGCRCRLGAAGRPYRHCRHSSSRHHGSSSRSSSSRVQQCTWLHRRQVGQPGSIRRLCSCCRHVGCTDLAQAEPL
jgi:hypothetical protein